MGNFKSFKESSKIEYGAELDANKRHSDERLMLGCLQRIADSSELMAKNHIQLQKEAQQWKDMYYRNVIHSNNLEKQLISTRGLVTRYKNQVKKINKLLQLIMDRPHISGEHGEKYKEHGEIETGHDAGTYASAYNYSLELVKFEIRKHTKIR